MKKRNGIIDLKQICESICKGKVYEEIKNNHPKKKMEYDTWDFRYYNDDHSIISCIINAI